MALTSVGYLGTQQIHDFDLDASAEAILSGASTLYAAELDNTANSVDVYVKYYTSSPTVGTTDPVYIHRVRAGQKRTIVYNGGLGDSFSGGLWVACVTTPGTAGASSPASNVKGRFVA